MYYSMVMRVHPHLQGTKKAFAVEYGTRDMSPVTPLKHKSGDNLAPWNEHGVLAKDINFDLKVGRCMYGTVSEGRANSFLEYILIYIIDNITQK
jgi:hypothetical protein